MSDQRDYGDEKDPQKTPSVRWRLSESDKRLLRSMRIVADEDK